MGKGGLGGGRGKGGVEEDIGKDGEDLGEMNAEFCHEIESEKGDGAVVATGG